MGYNPDIYHRRSIRLKGYDYSREGLYFITICTYGMKKIFGRIDIGADCMCPKMELSEAGRIAEEEWKSLRERYENWIFHDFVVMPNHFHGIVEIQEKEGVINNARTGIKKRNNENYYSLISPKGNSISVLVRNYKANVTRKIREYECRCVIDNTQLNSNIPIWHRNYYENIIRTEEAYLKVSRYIRENPARWVEDRYNTINKNID